MHKMTLPLIIILISTAALADDWPRWRGPDGNGISKETTWSPEKISAAKVLWRAEVGNGHSSMAVLGPVLYTMGNDGAQDTVFCLSTRDGSKVWTHSYACDSGNYSGPRAMPVLDGTSLYTLSRNGDLFCLDAKKGSVIWKKNVLNEFGGQNIRWGISGSPVIEGKMLLLNINHHGVALDKTTGSKIWASQPGKGGYASPVVFSGKSTKKRLAIFGEKGISLVDLASGKELWFSEWNTSYDVLAADPIIFDNKLYISSGYGKGAALFDLSSGKPIRKWESKSMKNHFSSSVVIDGHLYGVDGNTGKGRVVCLDPNSGQEKWSGGIGAEALVAAGNVLIVVDRAADLFAVKAQPGSYQEIARAKKIQPPKVKNWTAPVLANGRIYLRNASGAIACIDVSK